MNAERARDHRDLAILDAIEWTSPAQARREFDLTPGQVSGMRWRMMNPRNLPKCQCTKAANKDGGMPRLWWKEST